MAVEYENAADGETGKPVKSMVEVLQEQLKIGENKLRRLYSLYAASGDEYLLETIGKHRNEVAQLKEQIEEEKRREEKGKDAENIHEKIRSIAGVWEVLSQKERITAIRSIVKKIVITYDAVEIIYKI